MKGIKLRKALAAATAIAALTIVPGFAGKAEAATTSAGATVFNKVTVTYASGSVTGLVTTSSVKVTVTTLAAAPTVTVDTPSAGILSGAAKLYTYTIKSNSNGTDTYTLTTEGSSDTNMNTANTDLLSTGSIKLWGGFAVGSDAGYITVPGGSLTLNPIADGTKVMLTIGATSYAYSVASTAAGNAEDGTTKESADKIYLTPISGAPAINGNVTAGTQVGEYATFTNTVTAGEVKIDSSTATIADGTHLTVVKAVTAATDLGKNLVAYSTSGGDGNLTTTTILAPKLSIVKKSRNVTAGDATFTLSGTTARPGEVVEYEISIKNLHTDSSAVITSANVLDTLPSYSAYLAGSTKVSYNGGGFNAVSDNGTVSPLADPGYNLTTPLGAQQTAVIVYQAQVN